MDSSGSIKQENWDRIKNFMQSVVREFNVGRYATQFGTVVFGNDVNPIFELNKHTTMNGVLQDISQMR